MHPIYNNRPMNITSVVSVVKNHGKSNDMAGDLGSMSSKQISMAFELAICQSWARISLSLPLPTRSFLALWTCRCVLLGL